jgi:hypothetical protein
MVKKVLFIFVLSVSLYSSVYEDNCVKCHKNMSVKIDKFFYRYLLNYSSEENLKVALNEYLKYPEKKTSMIQESLIERFGIKKKTTLSNEDLKKAIDEYWNIYKVFGKLK